MENIQTMIKPSPGRRGLALLMLTALGGLLIYLAFSSPPASVLGQMFLLGLGGLALFGAEKMRRSTSLSIELLEDRIVDSSGAVLCLLSEIEMVERGAFAFKPSNGFLIRLKAPAPRAWAPGVWWRFGKKLGVGGVIPAADAKFMAELLSLRLKQ